MPDRTDIASFEQQLNDLLFRSHKAGAQLAEEAALILKVEQAAEALRQGRAQLFQHVAMLLAPPQPQQYRTVPEALSARVEDPFFADDGNPLPRMVQNHEGWRQ